MKAKFPRHRKTRPAARPAMEGLEPRKLLSAYALNTIAFFNNTNGANPEGVLTPDSSGNLFGTTHGGGANGDGTVFEIFQGTSSITTLVSFNVTNGEQPVAGVTFDSNGNLFGTTYDGGTNNDGTVFEIAKGATSLTTLISFNGTNGALIYAGLTLDTSGDLFGATHSGGANGDGTVFEIDAGTTSITTLASFNVTNGDSPEAAPTFDTSGDLFGTTYGGGTSGEGTVFKITQGATSIITTVASFNGTNGHGPEAGLASDSSGDLFGTTQAQDGADGTVFEIAQGASSITSLASFNDTNGAFLTANPTLDSNGNLFGTTEQGGASSDGTAFEIAQGTTTSITTLVTFNGTNGAGPQCVLSLDSSGNLFGTTLDGGPNGDGTVFELSPPSAQLALTTQPGMAVAGAPISPAVTVTVENSYGSLVPADTSAVTLSIASGPAGAVLDGPLTASAVNGVATFTNLSFSLPGTYTLQATDGTLTAATSDGVTVFAAPKIGGLDPSFGVGGLASHGVGLTSTAGVVVQGDGKSVIAGTAGSAGAEAFGITRYNTDGSVDTTFGTNGVTVTPLPGDAQAAAELLLSNGDILIAGTDTTLVNGQPTGSQFALAEYTSAGVLDTSFGNGAGYVLTSFSLTAGTLSNDVAHALAVGPDGTIYVGGSSDADGTGLDFAVAAYTPSGSPSPTFGTNGHALLGFLGGDNSIAALAFTAGGDLIAAGSAVDPSSGVSSVALAALLPTGALDPKFGVKGKVTKSVGSVNDGASALAIDARGNIVVGGYTGIGSASAGTLSSNFLLLRYTSAGKLDNTFGTHGIIITSFNQPAAISTVLIETDGTIVASGKTAASLTNFDPSMLNLAVARYTARGRLDTTFNGTGQLIVSLSDAAAAQSLTTPSGMDEHAFLQSLSAIPFDATSDKAAFMQLTQSDQGVIATTPSGELAAVGNSGSNTVEAVIISMGLDLAATLMVSLPPSVVGGTRKGTASVNVKEVGTQLAQGTFTVELFASDGPYVTAGQLPFQSFPEKLKLKDEALKRLHLRFQYPSSMSEGNYYLLATVSPGTASDLNLANNTSASGSSVLITPPFVHLAGSDLTAPVFTGVKPAVVSFKIMNAGNVLASAHSAVEFFAATGDTLSGAIALEPAPTPLQLRLRPGASQKFRVKLALPAAFPAGTYTLLALLDPANVFDDPNAATNFIVSGNTFVVG